MYLPFIHSSVLTNLAQSGLPFLFTNAAICRQVARTIWFLCAHSCVKELRLCTDHYDCEQ